MAWPKEIQDLAKRDSAAAYQRAAGLDTPWNRSQALGWVARYAPEGKLIRTTNAALAAAAKDGDPYRAVGASAWPIRALVERGEEDAARRAVQRVLPIAERIDHNGSRGEALMLLFEAVIPGAREIWQPVLEALVSSQREPPHWRHARALRDALIMAGAADAAIAAGYLPRIWDETIRERVEKAIAEGESREPRAFFW